MDHARLKKEIRRLVPIEALIGETVELLPSRHGLRGSCPSHPDAGRALHVDSEAGGYFCHACLRKGDVVRWTMENEAMAEEDALLALARRAGIDRGH